jgi:hypothetical protein
VGVGYLLSTPVGRAQLGKAKDRLLVVWHDERVQGWVQEAEDEVVRLAREQAIALKDRAVDAVQQSLAGH